jgi:hypothetical protein
VICCTFVDVLVPICLLTFSQFNISLLPSSLPQLKNMLNVEDGLKTPLDIGIHMCLRDHTGLKM